MSNIPKVINYFWFGGNPLPEEAKKCIASWSKFLPDYKIKCWDESNFDLSSCEYVQEAYKAKKWAFVSDYARIAVLAEYGGLYFDTDMELIKSIDDIIQDGSFINLEKIFNGVQAPGMSAMGVVPHLELFEDLVNIYKKRHFILNDGTYDETPIGSYVNEILIKNGVSFSNNITKWNKINFYPARFFSPMTFEDGRLLLKDDTRAIHHYAASWHDDEEKKATKKVQKITRLFGKKIGRSSHRIIFGWISIKKIYKNDGFSSTISFIKRKLKKESKE